MPRVRSLLQRFEKKLKKTWQMQKPDQKSDKWRKSMTVCKLVRQRKQSKTINQSRNVFDPWFMMNMINGTFVPSISPQVINLQHWVIRSSLAEVRNSCSTLSTIKNSVLLRIVNNTSFIFLSLWWTGERSSFSISQIERSSFSISQIVRKPLRTSKVTINSTYGLSDQNFCHLFKYIYCIWKWNIQTWWQFIKVFLNFHSKLSTS